jgi:tRNA A-37 threonylcarbamoyl transferase component Bud32/tetratricopeptide (TPR) repeat protein
MGSNGARSSQGKLLLEGVLDEQSACWDRGERLGAEEFFGRFPALRDDPQAAVDVIYQEFLLRHGLGEKPRAEEYIRRFHALSSLLIHQFAVDAALRSAEATTGVPGDGENGHAAQEKDGTSTAEGDAGSGGKVSSAFFPGYEFIAVIGRGGMGVVYKARDAKLGRIVAIKTITELEPAKPNLLGRFLDEAQAAARLQHPNIITVHAISEHNGHPYFALEFIDGGDLKKKLADKPMAPRQAAELIEILAHAVHAAHKAGVVHRDLKPSNILLTSGGVPKVADFSLAKLLGGDSGRTESGQVVGTPSYMAPEQAEGRSKDVGPGADVYALGAILFEALTGRPPFLGDTQLETLRLVTSTEPVPPRQLRPDIPRDIETICLKCLQKEPSKRHASADALAEDLHRFLDGRPITARRVGRLERGWRWCRRNPKLASTSALLAATVLLAAAAFIGLTYRHNVQLRAEVGRTQAKEAKARRNYQEARAAITAIVNRFDDRRLKGTPRLLELRGAVREDALAFYDRILNEVDSNDPAVRADTARALDEACILQHSLGRSDQARESIRQSLRLAESLTREHPDALEYMRLKLDSLMKLGPLLDLSKCPDDVLDACRESVTLAARLGKVMSDDLARQEQLAMCLTNYGNALWGLRRASEAFVQYQEATKIRRQIDPAKLPGVTLRLADSLLNEGLVLWGRNNFQAEEKFREAEALMLSIPPDRRDDGSNSVLAFARIYVNWGGVLNSMNRLDDAITRSDAGLKILEPYLRNEPNDLEARMVKLHLHGNRANSFAAKGKHRESADDWARVVELSAQPVPPAFRIDLAIALVRSGEIARASAQARLLPAAQIVSGKDRYNFGAYFALRASAVRKDPSVSPAERARLVDFDITEAMCWLTSAAETGLFKEPAMRDLVKKDPDFAALADRAEFQHLVERVQTER